MSASNQHSTGSASSDFESLVADYYEGLYRFAFSLTRSEADASDLTQHTFYIWATKGSQLRDGSKVKTWLFTTLHRAFLQIRRKEIRFPHYDLDQAESDLPCVPPARVNQLDSACVLQTLAQLDKTFQDPVAMFYLEDYHYDEIAQILDVPLGTVKSRISRGIAQLHELLTSVSVVETNRKAAA
jgi:RNA polymerase sigma factor (sigma-70 family)